MARLQEWQIEKVARMMCEAEGKDPEQPITFSEYGQAMWVGPRWMKVAEEVRRIDRLMEAIKRVKDDH